jgi:hypothetical protein
VVTKLEKEKRNDRIFNILLLILQSLLLLGALFGAGLKMEHRISVLEGKVEILCNKIR